MTRGAVFELYRGVFSRALLLCRRLPSLWDNACFLLQKQRNNAIKKEVRIMTQNNNSWGEKLILHFLPDKQYPLLAAVFCKWPLSFIWLRKLILQLILTAATLIGFLPQACLGPFAGAFVDRHSRKKRNDWCGFDNCRRWRYSGAGGVLHGIARMVYYGCPVNPKCGNCFSFSSIQRSNTYDCAKRGTYKMRWLHADHARSKCDYQSSCRSVFICCLAS